MVEPHQPPLPAYWVSDFLCLLLTMQPPHLDKDPRWLVPSLRNPTGRSSNITINQVFMERLQPPARSSNNNRLLIFNTHWFEYSSSSFSIIAIVGQGFQENSCLSFVKFIYKLMARMAQVRWGTNKDVIWTLYTELVVNSWKVVCESFQPFCATQKFPMIHLYVFLVFLLMKKKSKFKFKTYCTRHLIYLVFSFATLLSKMIGKTRSKRSTKLKQEQKKIGHRFDFSCINYQCRERI